MMNLPLCIFAVLSLLGTSHAKIFLLKGPEGRYTLSFWDAYGACRSLGASLASPNELKAAHKTGFSACSCGWLSDHTARYPITENDTDSCGVGVGIHDCTWRNHFNAYCITYDEMENCSKPLGLETGEIPHKQFTTTSVNKAFWGEPWSAYKATLNRAGLVNGWMPYHNGRNQYLQVDFNENMAITGIMTQGAKRYTKWQYVSKYKIKFTRDGGNTFTDYFDGKIFDGNTDNNGHVRNWFNPPILTSAIRIYPYSWYNSITLRVEFYGCTLDEHDQFESGQKFNKGVSPSVTEPVPEWDDYYDD